MYVLVNIISYVLSMEKYTDSLSKRAPIKRKQAAHQNLVEADLRAAAAISWPLKLHSHTCI